MVIAKILDTMTGDGCWRRSQNRVIYMLMEGWMLLHGHIEFESVKSCHMSLLRSLTVHENHVGLDSICPSTTLQIWWVCKRTTRRRRHVHRSSDDLPPTTGGSSRVSDAGSVPDGFLFVYDLQYGVGAVKWVTFRLCVYLLKGSVLGGILCTQDGK